MGRRTGEIKICPELISYIGVRDKTNAEHDGTVSLMPLQPRKGEAVLTYSKDKAVFKCQACGAAYPTTGYEPTRTKRHGTYLIACPRCGGPIMLNGKVQEMMVFGDSQLIPTRSMNAVVMDTTAFDKKFFGE